jgi:hypothetical protein
VTAAVTTETPGETPHRLVMADLLALEQRQREMRQLEREAVPADIVLPDLYAGLLQHLVDIRQEMAGRDQVVAVVLAGHRRRLLDLADEIARQGKVVRRLADSGDQQAQAELLEMQGRERGLREAARCLET